jgi:hypothetical protein
MPGNVLNCTPCAMNLFSTHCGKLRHGKVSNILLSPAKRASNPVHPVQWRNGKARCCRSSELSHLNQEGFLEEATLGGHTGDKGSQEKKITLPPSFRKHSSPAPSGHSLSTCPSPPAQPRTLSVMTQSLYGVTGAPFFCPALHLGTPRTSPFLTDVHPAPHTRRCQARSQTPQRDIDVQAAHQGPLRMRLPWLATSNCLLPVTFPHLGTPGQRRAAGALAEQDTGEPHRTAQQTPCLE